MGNLIRFLTITLTTGTAYMCLELIYRQHTHWTMLVVAGLTVYLIGLLDEEKRMHLKIWQQSLIGTIIATTIEFISGILINKILGWNVWDYSNEWGNLLGQICPLFMLFWFLLMPLGIWLDNYLRYKLFGEEKCESLFKIYIHLLTLE